MRTSLTPSPLKSPAFATTHPARLPKPSPAMRASLSSARSSVPSSGSSAAETGPTHPAASRAAEQHARLPSRRMTFMAHSNGAALRRFRTLDDDLVIEGENLAVLPALPDGFFDLVYIDPPFNTGRDQVRGERRYEDAFDDYPAFLRPRLEHARRLLAEHGTLYVHLDPRESHYVKVLLDELFGRDCFLNEIVWAYDYGGGTEGRPPARPHHEPR